MAQQHTINQISTASLEIKKSVFLSTLAPAKKEEDAKTLLAQIRKEHFRANHHVYCYVTDNGSVVRYSDDGEPGGRAGKPVYGVCEAHNLTDYVLVVTRYFGGTKLGAGGLTRAYAQAASMAVDNAQLYRYAQRTQVTISIAYNVFDKLTAWAQKSGAVLLEAVYGEDITLPLVLPEGREEESLEAIRQLTLGNFKVLSKEEKTQEVPISFEEDSEND